MEPSVLDKIVSVINQKFEGDVLQADMQYDFPVIALKANRIIEIIQWIKDHPDTEFRYLTTLCGIHYPEVNQIAVMYQLHNMVSNERVRLKIFVNADNPVVPTLTGVFAGANWMERETYDFFGVKFTGHPNLKRILNVEDMIIFPLRKEYPLEDQVRADKNDAQFGR
jgi:NADH-quinone oxidoreductase subunit C